MHANPLLSRLFRYLTRLERGTRYLKYKHLDHGQTAPTGYRYSLQFTHVYSSQGPQPASKLLKAKAWVQDSLVLGRHAAGCRRVHVLYEGWRPLLYNAAISTTNGSIVDLPSLSKRTFFTVRRSPPITARQQMEFLNPNESLMSHLYNPLYISSTPILDEDLKIPTFPNAPWIQPFLAGLLENQGHALPMCLTWLDPPMVVTP